MPLDFLTAAVRNAGAELDHELLRWRTQWEFAHWLAQRHPAEAAAWQPLLAQAEAQVRQAIDGKMSLAVLQPAIRQAEQLLAPVAAVARTYRVHLVGHAHIDMNWLWSWPETVAVTLDTFRTVLRLMEEFPEFRFAQSQASVYKIVQEHDPALLEAIAAQVRAGRWEVTASHWVEGDKNIIGGESLCRHLLYTRQYMKELFGLRPEDICIDWAPDTFGHAATMPMYLTRGGIRYVYLHRPGVHFHARPELFRWEGPDGSSVLVRNDMRLGYNGRIDANLSRHLAEYTERCGRRDFMFVYGVGDHGGGPTRHDLLWARELMSWPVMPTIAGASTRDYFGRIAEQAADLPVHRGELNTEFTGCYTTQSLIKRSNRLGENHLADAECAAALAAAATGYAYPTMLFRDGWRDVLFSHFHDILPGSGVRDTRTYTHGLFQQVMARTGVAETQALRALAARVDTQGPLPSTSTAQTHEIGAGVGFGANEGGVPHAGPTNCPGVHPLVIFNPTAWERTQIVEAKIWDNLLALPVSARKQPLKQRAFIVTDPEGNIVPHQLVDQGSYGGVHEFVTLAFPVRVPGLGYARYLVASTTTAAAESIGVGTRLKPRAPGEVGHLGAIHPCVYAQPERTPEGLENDLVRVEVDTATGAIRRFTDKRTGRDVIVPTQPAGLEFVCEEPHGMSAWSIGRIGPAQALELQQLKRGLTGPLRATLSAQLRIRASTFTLTYALYAGDPRLQMHVRGLWVEAGDSRIGVPALRLSLPVAVADAQACYEIPFGALDRPFRQNEEVPALQWAQVTGRGADGPAGLLLANDCKHGHALDGNILRLTLIRSAYDPDPSPDLGEHEFRLTLLPLGARPDVSAAIRGGQELNHALRVVATDVHAGPWTACGQLLDIVPAAVVVSGIKQAEDGSGLIVRLVNPTAAPVDATLTPADARLGKLRHGTVLDLHEQPLNPPAPVALVQGGARITLPAHGLATLKLTLGKPSGADQT